MRDFLLVVLIGLVTLLTLALVSLIWTLYVAFRRDNGQPTPTVRGIIAVSVVLAVATAITTVLIVDGKPMAGWVAMAAIGGLVQVAAPLKKSRDHTQYRIADQAVRDLAAAAGAGLTIVGSAAAAILEITAG